jgi:hypothetical protein
MPRSTTICRKTFSRETWPRRRHNSRQMPLSILGRGNSAMRAGLESALHAERLQPVECQLTPTSVRDNTCQQKNDARLSGLCPGRFHSYCGLIKIVRCGFLWEKTTEKSSASVYTYCETAPASRSQGCHGEGRCAPAMEGAPRNLAHPLLSPFDSPLRARRCAGRKGRTMYW